MHLQSQHFKCGQEDHFKHTRADKMESIEGKNLRLTLIKRKTESAAVISDKAYFKTKKIIKAIGKYYTMLNEFAKITISILTSGEWSST